MALTYKGKYKLIINLMLLATVLAFIFIAWIVKSILSPRADNVQQVDAIIVLGGGNGERLAQGLELVDAGLTGVLVLNKGVNWTSPAGKKVAAVCEKGLVDSQKELICIVAYPDSTKGEALTFAALASARGWNRLGIVTNAYHSARVRIWFERCFDGQVSVFVAPFRVTPYLFFRESAALIQTVFLNRSCS